MEDKKLLKKKLLQAPEQVAPDKARETQQILNLTESRVQDKFSDKNLDKRLEKLKLLDGREFSLEEFQNLIQRKARPYQPMFPVTYWREMYRLHGWPESEAAVFRKRYEAAIFNNEVIYGRFDKGVLRSMHVLNPYTGYMTRHYKHFQFLTPEGSLQLAMIITEAIDMMKTCTSYYEFRQKWFAEYGVPYQIELFK